MNTKHVLSVLLLIAVFAAGCKPESSARSAVSNTPAPQRSMRLSEPAKVTLAEPAINLERIGGMVLADNTLIAWAKVSDEMRPISINLENGQVQGLQEPLRLDSTAAMAARYLPRWTSYYDDKTQHQVGELFVTNLLEEKETKIATNLPSFAEVSGNTVVWQGQSDGGWGIYGYDIRASKLITIAGGPGSRTVPHVSGDWAIYLDMGKEAVLHAYNISTQENLTLGPTPYPRGRAGKYHLIGDGKVVWADATTYDLHVLDLSTRATEVITDPVTTCQPLYTLESMAKHTLLYTGCKGRALYDLDSKSNVDIPAGGGWIVMSESRVVWQEGNDLYTVRIER